MPKEEASVQIFICGKCQDLAHGAEMSGKLTCVRCAQVEDLQQLTELQETVKGLCAIWEAGIEMVSQIHVQSALNTQYGPKQP